MELQAKHLRDKNLVGRLGAIVISVDILLITLLGFVNGVTTTLLVRMVVAVGVIVLNLIIGLKMKDSPYYVHVCCCSLIVLYFTTMFTARVASTYALLYVIAILIMAYTDGRLVIAGTIVALIGLVCNCVVLLSMGTITVNEIIMEFAFAIPACMLVIWITKMQIRHAKENLSVVKAGADAQAQTSGEIGKLAEELNQKFVRAQEVSETLNETMRTSHDSVSEISESTKLTAEAIERQTSQTSDIQQSIQQVGEEARSIGDISDRTSVAVNEGVNLIEKLKEQAAEVAKINTETKETTEALNISIKDVQAITETILGISSQTNLLALNASIEAARAGEAGKGFAVVADEIRSLSEGTRQATEQISAIIARLTKDAQIAADSMMQSAEYAQRQNELITETGNKLADIQAETEELHRGVVQVNGAVQNVIAANTIIMDSISNLSATSQQVAASSETMLTISDSSMTALENMNDLLSEISEISENMEAVAK